MDEQDIELLKTLIDTQNITKTAKKLYTTQSSLTKRIQKMEQDLGCQLFIRSRKGILPTPAAEGIFPEIEKISQSMEHIRAYALSLQGEICGSLKIGVSVNIARYKLPAVFSGIAAFMVFDMVYNGNSPDQAILSQVEITAHRGSSKHAPENTMAAIEEAIGEMADYSEIDVQLSKDGVPVVCHDLNLSRVAGVDVSLKNLTFDELEQLDVGSHFSSRFEGEKIPSLEEVLEACKGRIRLNIELKSIGTKSPLPEVVTEMIKEMGMEDQCVITSVSLDYLKRVKEAEPELKTGYILAAAYGSYYKNEFVDFISIRSSLVTKKQIQAAHEYGKAIHVWTVNSRSEIEQMALMGVDNIITDYPTRAKEVLYQPDVAKNLLTYIRQVMK